MTLEPLAPPTPHVSNSRARVAFQGIDFAYSHLAGRQFFGERSFDAEFVGLDSFRDVVDAVERGEAGFGMLPIENTIAGSINETYQLLAGTSLTVVGEQPWRVRHCLAGVAEVTLDRVRRVLSHPQALLQCAQFTARLPGVTVESYLDTAAAARKVRNDGDPTQAAIASVEAATHFGLHILATDIGDQHANFTRFVVVAREPLATDPKLPHKVSLWFVTAHTEGALFKCLQVLHVHRLNMTKLESRPIPQEPWEYQFYVDFLGNIADPNVESALALLKHETRHLRVLGCYLCHPDAAPGNGRNGGTTPHQPPRGETT